MQSNTYVKRPVEIEAAQFSGLPQTVPSWIADAMDDGSVSVYQDRIEIHTLEGVMTASPGDWIIRGVKGELYPCEPDIFEATYKLV